MLNHINFRTEPRTLKKLAYADNIYAWLLLHSHFNVEEKHNYIYKEEFTFKQIAEQVHRHRTTVSDRFQKLKEAGIIHEYTYRGKTAYKIPYYKEFQELDGETVFRLLCLPVKDQKEELIKTYAYLLQKKRQEGPHYSCSSKEILEAFGHSVGNTSSYERIRCILTILQGAGIIKFRTVSKQQKEDGTWRPEYMEIYQINQKASEEWLGKENGNC